jgi:hypothetical protein
MTIPFGTFAQRVESVFSPWCRASGTEHMALLLYSLVRSTRPRTVVERGPGYTTFLLARALQDNLDDVVRERELLLDKSAFVTPDYRLPADPLEAQHVAEGWLTDGGMAANVDPRFHLREYVPRLYCLESNLADHPYMVALNALIAELQLERFVTVKAVSQAIADAIPASAMPIDLAWNDDDHYREFFTDVWPHLNPEGGLLVFHYTSAPVFADDIAWMMHQRQQAGDLERLTVVESHKLVQNGCTILRRTAGCTRRDSDILGVVDALKQLMAQHRGVTT